MAYRGLSTHCLWKTVTESLPVRVLFTTGEKAWCSPVSHTLLAPASFSPASGPGPCKPGPGESVLTLLHFRSVSSYPHFLVMGSVTGFHRQYKCSNDSSSM